MRCGAQPGRNVRAAGSGDSAAHPIADSNDESNALAGATARMAGKVDVTIAEV
jgi:hypothetical protein